MRVLNQISLTPRHDNSLINYARAQRIRLGPWSHHMFEASKVSLVTLISFYLGCKGIKGFFFAMGKERLCYTSFSFKNGWPLSEYGYCFPLSVWGEGSSRMTTWFLSEVASYIMLLFGLTCCRVYTYLNNFSVRNYEFRRCSKL